jgi:hypothetical protein
LRPEKGSKDGAGVRERRLQEDVEEQQMGENQGRGLVSDEGWNGLLSPPCSGVGGEMEEKSSGKGLKGLRTALYGPKTPVFAKEYRF